MTRTASVKETGEELSPAEWERFEAAVRADVRQHDTHEGMRDATTEKRRDKPPVGPTVDRTR